jgi:hypothetical protein
MYEDKIREGIYVVTGWNDIDSQFVNVIATDVMRYLTALKNEVVKAHTERLQHKKSPARSKKVHELDVYQVLRGTPELYGVKRCIILKGLSRQAEKSKNQDDNDDLQTGEEQPLDTVQAQLRALDDGTDEYKTSEAFRFYDLKQADELTSSMTADEYRNFGKRKSKMVFVDKPKRFCEWIEWHPNPPRIILTAFGWLATYRIKRLLQQRST